MVEKEARKEKTIRRVIPTIPLSYFGPIEEYVLLAKHNTAQYELHEHFVKQSFRNRCVIYGANGELKLTVPLVLKSREKTTMENVKISYAEKWQANHWKAIVASYKNSPFFEHYEEELVQVFLHEYEYLKDLNQAAQKTILNIIGIQPNILTTTEFEPILENDYRASLHPKKSPILENKRYIQVFEEKHGFIPNLSILDLIFNEGPVARLYLNDQLR